MSGSGRVVDIDQALKGSGYPSFTAWYAFANNTVGMCCLRNIRDR